VVEEATGRSWAEVSRMLMRFVRSADAVLPYAGCVPAASG